MLALFCLAWLQFAAMPCALAGGVGEVIGSLAEHDCPYCPPPDPAPDCHDPVPGGCTYPDDPQVDTRGTLGGAATMPVMPAVFMLPLITERADGIVDVDGPQFVSSTPLAVSYCRFLK